MSPQRFNLSSVAVKRSTRKKVAILGARYGDLIVERRALGPLGVDLSESSGSTEDEIIAASEGAQVILCGGAPKINAAVIRRLPELKAVVRYGIGVDTVDLGECTERGIYVANVPDYCIDEVAAHALTLVLNWSRKLPIAKQTTKSGQWDIAALRPLESPRDQVLGLLGFGRIAQALCRMSRAIGFQVWAHDPYVEKSRIRNRGAQPVSLQRLIRGADFISLHLPLTAKTRHIINAQRLGEMKATSYLINTARGELVDEKALQQALLEGRIGGAGLDVMEHEPPDRAHPLRFSERVVITPHCAWYTQRSQKELRQKACAEAIRVLRGGIPKNLVNRPPLR
jgi:D-3-phosphoglycerate dehydrogenase / 2-oxoglutarate reductase